MLAFWTAIRITVDIARNISVNIVKLMDRDRFYWFGINVI